MTPYSPSEKAKLLSKAQKLIREGMLKTPAARTVGIHPATLNRWLKERKSGFERIRHELNLASEEAIGEACEAIGMSAPSLSWKETQELCAEYSEHSKKIKELSTPIYKIDIGGFLPQKLCSHARGRVFVGKSDIIAAGRLDERLQEIKEQVGQDALDQYEEMQKLKQRVSKQEEELSNTKALEKWHIRLLVTTKAFAIYSIVVATLALWL